MKISLQDFAYGKCRELLEQGDLQPGELYSEAAISKQLNISRTPLRGAIQRLEKEGLVTRLPQRGFHVNEFGKEDIEELFTIRKAIEGYAVEQLAKNIDDVGLRKFQQFLSEQEGYCEIDDFQPFIDADRIFHEEMVNFLDNKRLVEMYGDLRLSIALFARKRFRVTRQRDQSLAEHKEILAAIEKGDSTAAREAIYHHMDSVLELYYKQEI